MKIFFSKHIGFKQANPTHEIYLNQEIDRYDEINVVVRKDVTRGNCAKSFDDMAQAKEAFVDFEETGDGDNEIMKNNDM